MKYFHLVAGTCPTNSTHEGTKHSLLGGDGQEAGDREKRGLEVYGRREKRGREAGEKGKNVATLRNISQSKKCKGAGAKKYRAGTEIKGVREAGGSNPPVPPPTSLWD